MEEQPHSSSHSTADSPAHSPADSPETSPDSDSDSPFARYFGVHYGRSEAGVGTVSLPLQPHHLQGAGVVHGGMVASLADTAGFWAVRSLLGPGERTTTVELKLNFLAPASTGTLHAKATVLDYSNRLAVIEIEVTDDAGTAVAQALATYLVMG